MNLNNSFPELNSSFKNPYEDPKNYTKVPEGMSCLNAFHALYLFPLRILNNSQCRLKEQNQTDFYQSIGVYDIGYLDLRAENIASIFMRTTNLNDSTFHYAGDFETFPNIYTKNYDDCLNKYFRYSKLQINSSAFEPAAKTSTIWNANSGNSKSNSGSSMVKFSEIALREYSKKPLEEQIDPFNLYDFEKLTKSIRETKPVLTKAIESSASPEENPNILADNPQNPPIENEQEINFSDETNQQTLAFVSKNIPSLSANFYLKNIDTKQEEWMLNQIANLYQSYHPEKDFYPESYLLSAIFALSKRIAQMPIKEEDGSASDAEAVAEDMTAAGEAPLSPERQPEKEIEKPSSHSVFPPQYPFDTKLEQKMGVESKGDPISKSDAIEDKQNSEVMRDEKKKLPETFNSQSKKTQRRMRRNKIN